MGQHPIGILDSGVGGLSVARALLDRLPGETILYYADSANFPYGERTPAEVRALMTRGIHDLAALDPTCIVVACNTASASTLEGGDARPPVPIFEILSSSSLIGALRAWIGARIGLIATPLTVATHAYQALVEHFTRPRALAVLATPLLVRLVEGGGAGAPGALDLVEAELAPLARERLDALILGCTHFSFLAAPIRATLGPSVTLIDPAHLVAQGVADALETAGLADLSVPATPRAHRLIVTGGRARQITAAAARVGLRFDRFEFRDGASPSAGGGHDAGIGKRRWADCHE